MKNLTKLTFMLLAALLTATAFCAPVCAGENPRIDGNYAEALKELGLFIGTDQGLNLEKKLNRDEAAVMLVRLLGAEEEARAGEYVLPFRDVDEWAKPYVGWLYEHKLAYGMDENRYGSKNAVTGQQYITFLLRCLGYSEAEGDFTYNGVFDFILEKEFFKDNDSRVNFYRYYCPDFLRYDCTELTFRALMWKMKGGDKDLAEELLEKGVFTRDKFIEQLWTFADSYGVNSDGRIVHKYGGGIELPALGMSKESYDYTGWEQDEYIFGFVDTGNNYNLAFAVDAKTLERKSQLSDKSVSLVDMTQRNGLLYFYEWENNPIEENASRVFVKSYDWKSDTVTEVLNCDASAAYNTVGNNFYIAGKFGDEYGYKVIDLLTGQVKSLFSEKADAMYAWGFSYNRNDNYSTTGYSTLFKLFAGDEIHYYIYELDTFKDSLKVPKRNNFTSEGGFSRKVFSNALDDKPPYFFSDNDTFYEIDADKKISILTGFSKSIVSAFIAESGNIYVLTGKEYYGEELGALDKEGNYSVLSPESTIKELGVVKIIGADAEGNVKFISESDVGMMNLDIFTYVYNAGTNKITVESFVPGRGEFYTEESIKQLLAETQKKLDELQR